MSAKVDTLNALDRMEKLLNNFERVLSALQVDMDNLVRQIRLSRDTLRVQYEFGEPWTPYRFGNTRPVYAIEFGNGSIWTALNGYNNLPLEKNMGVQEKSG